jgi:hypothetical protein
VIGLVGGLWLALGSPPTVTWDAPPGVCPTGEELALRIASEQQGTQPIGPVAVLVRSSGGGWRADLSGAITRSLQAKTCDELADAVVLLVRLASEGEQPEPILPEPPSIDAPEASSSVAPANPAASGDSDDDEIAAEPAPSTRRRPRWSVGAQGGVLFFIAQPAGSFELVTGPRGRGWSVDFGLASRPLFSGSEVYPGVSTRFSVWAALVEFCGVPGVRIVEIPLCVGFEAGGLNGLASGALQDAQRRSSAWLAGRASIGARFRAHSMVWPFVRVGMVALAARPNFFVDGAGRACCDRALGLTLGAGVEVRFGEEKGR